jgi:tetratricopeptide (TPR) repeat protein
MLKILRRFALLLLLLSSSLSAWAGFIRGQVKFENGQYADHVVVKIRSDMIAYQNEMQTDSQGKFNFDGLPLSTFHLIIEGQGFLKYESRIDISMSKMAYEQITLRLERNPETNFSPRPDGVISAQEAAMPEAARKEYAEGRALFMEARKPHDSIPHFQKAIALYPSNPDVYILLAMAYMQDSNPKAATETLRKNTEANPQSADAHITLGLLLNQEKDFAEAEKTLLRGIELNPDIPQGHYELAKTYWALGRWQEAEPEAQKAVKLQPDMAPPHVILGNIAFTKKHDSQAALKEFQEYLRLDPNGPMAQGTQQMITKIEQSLKTSN